MKKNCSKPSLEKIYLYNQQVYYYCIVTIITFNHPKFAGNPIFKESFVVANRPNKTTSNENVFFSSLLCLSVDFQS